MRQASKRVPHSAEKTVRDIRRATRRHHSAEEKIRNVLEGLRGEDSVAELCRKEGINQNLYYRWSKEFLEAGKKRLACDDRIELHRHLIDAGRAIPTILVTAYPNDVDRIRALNDGVVCYLRKPVDEQHLKRCLHAALTSGE